MPYDTHACDTREPRSLTPLHSRLTHALALSPPPTPYALPPPPSEHLTSHDVAHRDLHCDNLLIDSTGRLKLIDFGLAKVIRPMRLRSAPSRCPKGHSCPEHFAHAFPTQCTHTDLCTHTELCAVRVLPQVVPEGTKTHTFCGAPFFMAPEALRKIGHSVAVDRWAFGCVFFAMACGEPNGPFYDEDADDHDEEATTWVLERIRANSYEEERLPEQCRGLVASLLLKEPTKRASWAQVRADPFFAPVSGGDGPAAWGAHWERLLAHEVEAPRTWPSVKTWQQVRDAAIDEFAAAADDDLIESRFGLEEGDEQATPRSTAPAQSAAATSLNVPMGDEALVTKWRI